MRAQPVVGWPRLSPPYRRTVGNKTTVGSLALGPGGPLRVWRARATRLRTDFVDGHRRNVRDDLPEHRCSGINPDEIGRKKSSGTLTVDGSVLTNSSFVLFFLKTRRRSLFRRASPILRPNRYDSNFPTAPPPPYTLARAGVYIDGRYFRGSFYFYKQNTFGFFFFLSNESDATNDTKTNVLTARDCFS